MYARRFRADAAPAGPAFLAHSPTSAKEEDPAVGVAPGGAFVLTWTRRGGGNPTVRGQRFDAAGTGLGEFPVQATPAGEADRSAVAVDAAGNFAVVWSEKDAGPDPSGWGVRLRRFAASGAALTGDVLVNATYDGDQDGPSIAVTSAGHYVVAWESDGQDGNGAGVYARTYLANGTPDAGEFRVNVFTPSDQRTPAVAVNDAGRLVVAWDAPSGGGYALARVYSWSFPGAPPAITAPTAVLTYTEDDPPLGVGAGLTVTDPDSPLLAGAAVAIPSGFTRGEDVLGYDAALSAAVGVTGKYDPATGVLWLSGPAPVADYERVLRTVTYQNTSQRPSPARRAVRFHVGDGTSTAAATQLVDVVPVNDPPAAADDKYTLGGLLATLDVPAPGVLANDADPDGDRLTAVLVTGPSRGTLTLNPDGSFRYTPNPLFLTGTDTFTYRATDGQSASPPVVVTIRVGLIADAAPVGTDDGYTTPEDTPLTVTAPGPLANDADPDGDTVAAVLVSGPAHGTLDFNPDGSFTYTPTPDYFGPDSFTYRTTAGGLSSGPVRVELTVTPVDDPPTLDPIADATVAEDSGPTTVTLTGITAGGGEAQTLTVTATSSDPGLIPDPAVLFSSPGSTGTLTVTPLPGAAGTAVVTVTVSDSTTTVTRTFAVTVTPVNDAPTAADDGFTTAEDTPLSGDAVLTNDTDPDGDPLRAILIGGPARGTLVLNPDGTFTYTPDPNFAGTDTFTYRVSDGAGDTATATVTLVVLPVNDAPAAAADAYSVGGGGVLTVAGRGVLTNDTDPDGDALTVRLVAGPGHGTLALAADGTFVYTPDPGFAGTDTFTYRATDGGLDSDAVTVTVVVRPADLPPVIDRPPIAVDDSYAVDGMLIVPGPSVLDNDRDPDGDPLTAVLVRGPAHGTLTLAADGAFAYTPDPGFAGTDTFTYRATADGLDSDDVTVTIVVRPTVIPVEPPPSPPEPVPPLPEPESPRPDPRPPEPEPPPEPDRPELVDDPPPAAGDEFPRPTQFRDVPEPPAEPDPPPTEESVPAGRPQLDFRPPPGVFTFTPDVATGDRDDRIVREPEPRERTLPVSVINVTGGVGQTTGLVPGPTSVPAAEVPLPPPIDRSPTPTAPRKPAAPTAPAPGPAVVAPAPTPLAPAPAPPAAPPQIPPPTALPRADGPTVIVSEALAAGLDGLAQEVRAEAPVEVATDLAVSAGVVAVAGYVLFSPRTVFWLLSAVLARPAVWRSFDPLEVVYAWEREREGDDDRDDESLQSMVGGSIFPRSHAPGVNVGNKG